MADSILCTDFDDDEVGEDKANSIDSVVVLSDETQATNLKIEIYHSMSLVMMNEQISDAARRIVMWCCFHLASSKHADIVPVNKRFLPGDIQRSVDETKEGYRQLYELGLIERVDSIEHSDDILPIRLVVAGVNDSKHPFPYKEELFGYEGARINGESTFGNSHFVELPPIYSRTLKWNPLTQDSKALDLKCHLQGKIGPERIHVTEVKCEFISQENAPRMVVVYRVPISQMDGERSLQAEIDRVTLTWLKEQTVF